MGSSPGISPTALAALRVLLAVCMLMAWGAAPAHPPVAPLPPLNSLPPPAPRIGPGESLSSRIHPGTDGLALPAPPAARGRITVALLGDLAPAPDPAARDAHLIRVAEMLNLLRPDLVLTAGNLVPGFARSGEEYVRQTAHLCELLDELKMPWYPCAGTSDLAAAPDAPAEPRFSDLYRRYVGPLYYSLDAGDVHAVVLSSEDGLDASRGGIGNEQLRWLRGDLNRVFDAPASVRPRWIIVVVHRPLWREIQEDVQAAARPADRGHDWSRVHDLLVAFNRRPVVSIEGPGQGVAADMRGPRVVAVFAGSCRAYSQEPVRDGIRYYVLGPAAAAPAPGLDSATALRHVMLLKFDPSPATATSALPAATDAGMYTSLIRLDDLTPAILPEDAITWRQRQVIDRLVARASEVVALEGVIDPEARMPATVSLRLSNPLADPIELKWRLSSASNLTPAQRDSVNAPAEGLDLHWQLDAPRSSVRLEPGARETLELSLWQPKVNAPTSPAPPQLETLVRWLDPRGPAHEWVLKRHIAVSPVVELPIAATPLDPIQMTTWHSAGEAYAWNHTGDAPRPGHPAIRLAADGAFLHVRIEVDDPVASFISGPAPIPGQVPACDALRIDWLAPPQDGASDSPRGAMSAVVRSLWVFPFAPEGPRLVAGEVSGVRDSQTPAIASIPTRDIPVRLTRLPRGYVVTLSLPRNLLFERLPPPPTPGDNLVPPGLFESVLPFPGPRSPHALPSASPPAVVLARASLNVTVIDNDQATTTWIRSWVPDATAGGPGFVWARIRLIAEASPTTLPAAPRP